MYGMLTEKPFDRMYGIYRIGGMFSHHVHLVNPVRKMFGQDEQDLQDTFGSSGASPHRELVYGVALIDTFAVFKWSAVAVSLMVPGCPGLARMMARQ